VTRAALEMNEDGSPTEKTSGRAPRIEMVPYIRS
jgi:hypothetical protein